MIFYAADTCVNKDKTVSQRINLGIYRSLMSQLS